MKQKERRIFTPTPAERNKAGAAIPAPENKVQELSILMVQFLPGVYYIFFVKAIFFKKQPCDLS